MLLCFDKYEFELFLPYIIKRVFRDTETPSFYFISDSILTFNFPKFETIFQ